MTKVGTPISGEPATVEEELSARRQDVIDTFTTEAGKRVLTRLIAGNMVLNTSYTPGDPHSTSFCEGRRAVVIEILSTMGRGLTPEDTIQKEH